MLALAACLGVAACTSSPTSPSPLAAAADPGTVTPGPRDDGPIQRVVRGDWNDAEAAAIAAAVACEMAVLRASRPTEDLLTFSLTTIRDEPAALVLTRMDPADTAEPSNGLIGLRAKVGRFGDPDRESALMAAVTHRLSQLAGRDSAPRR